METHINDVDSCISLMRVTWTSYSLMRVTQTSYSLMRVTQTSYSVMHVTQTSYSLMYITLTSYSLMCVTQTPYSLMCLTQSVSSVQVGKIVTSEEGEASSTECLNLADSLDRRISKDDAQTAIKKFVEERWLYMDVSKQWFTRHNQILILIVIKSLNSVSPRY